MKKTTLTGIIMLLIMQLSFSQVLNKSPKRISIISPSQIDLSEIKKSGIDFTCGGKYVNNNLELELTFPEIQILKKLNINFNVIIDDLETYYKERNKRELPKAKSELNRLKSLSQFQKTLSVKDVFVNNPAQIDECDELDWAN